MFKALPYSAVYQSFVFEPSMSAAVHFESIGAVRVGADIRLKVLKDMGSPSTILAMARWTENPTMGTKKGHALGSLCRR